MSSIFGIGTSALSAFRSSLDTISQNIANANTDGYNRQRVTLGTRQPQFVGFGYIGSGVEATSVTRSYDQYLDAQTRSATASAARFSTLASFAGRIDDLLAEPSSGLSPSLSDFYDALQDFSVDPASTASRAALLSQTDSLISRFQSIDASLAEIGAEARGLVAETVNEINGLAESIAELNREIGRIGVGAPPNDLLDRRDLLIRQLAEKVDVTAVPDGDGSISLFVGSGQTLVIGEESYRLGVQPNQFDPSRSDIVYEGLNGDTPVTDLLSGGTIGALAEFDQQVLSPARRALGQTATALAAAVNAQNALGLDADDNRGTDIFAVGGPLVQPSRNNSGSATADVSIDDLSALANSNFRLLFDGSNYRLFRGDNDTEIALTGSGTAADPFVGGGLSIVVGGTPAAGDRFELEPTLGAVGGLRRVAENAKAFAAAGLVRATGDSNNLSDAVIDNGTIVDADDPGLFATSTIEFLTPTSYSVNGGGSVTFTPGDPIAVNGVEFRITGAPTAGDRFTIEKNTNATGDNRNALALNDTRALTPLASGTTSISQSYSQLVASVGSATRQASASADAQSILLSSAETRRLSASGVNLDEEAASLIQYQQAYQAAAQVISVASNLFDTLLAATRR